MPTTPTLMQPILDLLDQAERECSARGNQATHTLDDLTIWHFDARLTRLASNTLRCAVHAQLPPSDPFEPAGDRDPLQLVQEALTQLLDLPEDLDNVQLLLARLRTSDALSAIRTHYV